MSESEERGRVEGEGRMVHVHVLVDEGDFNRLREFCTYKGQLSHHLRSAIKLYIERMEREEEERREIERLIIERRVKRQAEGGEEKGGEERVG